MRRFLVTALASAAFLVALAAPAQGASLRELGYSSAYPFPSADCPENCQAIAQVTGFQVQLGKYGSPMKIRRPGWLVAFTVKLSKPSSDQTDFFKSTYGSRPQARLAVLHEIIKRVKKKRRHTHRYRLLKETQPFNLQNYFGSTPTVALHKALRVHRDDVVAITVPTWLPAFAHGLSKDMAWRSSHSGSACTDTNPPSAAHTRINTVKLYGCLYRTARLLYTTTFVADPKVTNKTK